MIFRAFLVLGLQFLGPLAAQPPDQPWQMRFDGLGGVKLPVHPSLDLGAKYTFMVWVRPERYPTEDRDAVILGKALSTPGNPFFGLRLSLEASGAVSYGQSTGDRGTFQPVSTSLRIPLHQWTHIAVTSDGTTVTLYVDGAPTGAGPSQGPIPVNDQPLSIGAEHPPAGFGFSNFAGLIRQVSLWNFAFTPDQVREERSSHFDGREPGLAGFWPLDDGSGVAVRDMSPAGLHGQVFSVNRQPDPAGVRLRSQQYQPTWLKTDRLDAGPFDWAEQRQPTRQVGGVNDACLVDFDHDGDLDILDTGAYVPLTTLDEPIIRAFRNDGKGAFTEATSEVFGDPPVRARTPGRCVVTDLNQDGLADVLLGDYGDDYGGPEAGIGRPIVLIQTAAGQLRDESSTRANFSGKYIHDMDAADIDGDGDTDWILADVAAAAYPGNFRLTLLINDGAGNFSLDNSRLPGSATVRRFLTVRFFDADGDGDNDLFLGDSQTRRYDALLINDGKGRFTDSMPGALPPRMGGGACSTLNAGVVDLNQDAAPDLILSHDCGSYVDGGNEVLINRGDGTFSNETAQWLPESLLVETPDPADSFPWPHKKLIADFNSDGRPDVYMRYLNDRHRLFLNNGTRLVEVPEYLPNPDRWAAVVVGDLDGDGRPDIAVADSAGRALPNTYYVGLNKRDVPAPDSPAPADPLPPSVLFLDIVNEASRSANALAPGTRVRIRGRRLGPAEGIAFAESAGAAPPLELGGVTVTMGAFPARLLFVSETEIVAIVPYSLTGRWTASVRVTNNGLVSEPAVVPMVPANPQIFGSLAADGSSVADAWKIVDGNRVKIRAAGQLAWGDRVAFRVTGAGQSTSPLTDSDAAAEQAFTPAVPLQVGLSQPGDQRFLLTPVSMTHAPDGLQGVVEVVVDLPAAQPQGAGTAFYIGFGRYRSANDVNLPFGGAAGVSSGGCTYNVDPLILAVPAGASTQIINVNATVGCPWQVAAAQDWTVIRPGVQGVGSGQLLVSIDANGAPGQRSGSLTVAGHTVVIVQRGASSPVGSGTNGLQDQSWLLRLEGWSAVSLPVRPELDLGSSYTFQFWVNPERRTRFPNLLRKQNVDPGSDPYQAFTLGLDDQDRLWFNQTTGLPGSGRGPGSPLPLPAHEWTHIAVTSDGTSIRLYVNGSEAGRAPSPGPIPVSGMPISLGGIVTDKGYACCGMAALMRQFSVWSRPLSPAEIRTTMSLSLSGAESGLVGYWPLDDGAGYTLRDLGPNKMDATLVYPNLSSNMNGTTSRTMQYQPAWLRTSLWSANPFDWLVQPQATHHVPMLQRLIPIDFDNDGDADLIGAGMYNPGKPEPALKAYRNDGKGAFAETTADVLGAAPVVVRTAGRSVVADLNKDGLADLIVSDYGSDFAGVDNGKGQNRVFIQTPSGQLRDETAARMPMSGTLVHDMDGADVNGDGHIDLVYADVYGGPFSLTLAMNDGTGRFKRENNRLPASAGGRFPTVTRLFDANGDGRPDLFLGSGDVTPVTSDLLLLNDGSGFFRGMAPGALPVRLGGANCGTVGAGVGDLNGDNRPDLLLSVVCGRYTDTGFQVLINRGDGTFADQTAQWLPETLVVPSLQYANSFPWMRTVNIADFNGDGRMDVVFQSLGSNHRLYLNTGSRLVQASEFLPNPESSFPRGGELAVADVNADGRPDIVVADQSTAAFDTLYVGVNKRAFPDVPAPPAEDAEAPRFLRLGVVNEASLSADPLAPGTRVRIRGAALGPAAAVRFTESAGAAPPTTLGGVTVTFNGTPARLTSVSATELTAMVPFSMAGQFIATIQVAYDGRVSSPVAVPVTPSNPQFYITRGADGMPIAEAWRIVNGGRTKVTAAGQLKWGDRVAFRFAGLGQTAPASADALAPAEQAISPAVPLQVLLGDSGKSQNLNVVSIKYAPEGLSGVVEAVVDLPGALPAGFSSQVFVRNPAFTGGLGTWLPFAGPGK